MAQPGAPTEVNIIGAFDPVGVHFDMIRLIDESR
jgi:hypothetical protein